MADIHSIAIKLLKINDERIPKSKIEKLDKVIDDIENLIYITQTNWVSKDKRLERAKKKKKELDSYIELLSKK